MAVAVGFEPTEGVNPHALSRSATGTSAPIVQGVPTVQPAGAVPDDHRRSCANATRIAPGIPQVGGRLLAGQTCGTLNKPMDDTQQYDLDMDCLRW
jgi:hypothetical protein